MDAPIRVLYVDDDPEFAARAADALERADDRFAVETTTRSRDALEFLTEHGVDCVVSEYDLPETDGVAFLEAVRENHPSLPFVLFTGSGSEAVASDAIAAGVTDYLRKDAGPDQCAALADRVLAAVRRAHSERVAHEERLRSLSETTRKLLAADSQAAVAETTVDAARSIVGLNMSAIHRYDESERALVPVVISEEARELVGEPPDLGVEDSIAWRAFDSGEPLAVDDVHADPDVHNPETPVRSELFLPLGDYGVLAAGSTSPGAFDKEDIALGEVLAGNVVTALEQVRRTAELRSRERELSERNERLAEFASVVSHDLRNPLNVAEGHRELAAEECDSSHLDEVATAHDRMQALIDDLLALTHDGAQSVDLAAVDLASLAEESWATVDTDDATLTVAVDGTIRADEGRVRQLFENLFRNAVEHGSTGPALQARQDAVEHGPGDAGNAVAVTVGGLDDGFYVEDDGPGVPADDRERVFEYGYSTSDDGTGFGLSIVEQVAHAHGWNVRLTDGSDGGARFEFENAPSSE